MSMEHIQPAGSEAAAAMFAEAVARTGLLTMQDVVRRSGISLKTVAKHRREGLIAGQRRLVFGKLIWMFEPADVERYAQVALSEATRSRSEGKVRGARTRSKAPPGHLTVADIVRESGRSIWCVYAAIERGDLPASKTGIKGAYLVRETDARAWISVWRYLPLLDGTTTISDAARRCGLTYSAVEFAIKSGRMAAYDFGDVRNQKTPGGKVTRARWRVRLDDVRELARRRTARITSTHEQDHIGRPAAGNHAGAG